MNKLNYDELECIYYKIKTVDDKMNYVEALNNKELMITHIKYLNNFYKRYLNISLDHPFFDCFIKTDRYLACECGHKIYRHCEFVRNFMLVLKHYDDEYHKLFILNKLLFK